VNIPFKVVKKEIVKALIYKRHFNISISNMDEANPSVSLEIKDLKKDPDTEKFDKIMCGEFLEHVEDPVGILTKLNQLLKDDGKLFLTAAVWAAHIDHIYLYNNAEEVRNHIRKAGFLIEKELVQASFEKDEADPEKSKIPVSYAAILSKN